MGGLLSIEESIQNTDTAPPPESETATEPAPPVIRPRRRVLRTVGLIAVAAVLGLVGGTAVGYGIQAEREPTPLAALNQPPLVHPKPLPKGQEPEPLPEAEDRQAKWDGDLRKLLVPRPKGARADGQDGWQSVAEYANGFTRPEWTLRSELALGVRRIAARSWRTGEDRWVKVSLVQYRAKSVVGALRHVTHEQAFASREEEAGDFGEEVKGSGNGRYYVYPVRRKAGHLDFHHARAVIQRGDIAIIILMSDSRKIAEKDIRSLAEQQLERL